MIAHQGSFFNSKSTGNRRDIPLLGSVWVVKIDLHPLENEVDDWVESRAAGMGNQPPQPLVSIDLVN
jgi:hypothetical protein